MTTSRSRAVSTTLIDNARVKVTEWRFAPGAETGWHVHAMDYVVVPQTNGRLLLEEPDGNRHSQLTIGVPYTREAGVKHNVVNDNPYEFVFIEVEIK